MTINVTVAAGTTLNVSVANGTTISVTVTDAITTPPTCTITMSDYALGIGETATVTFTFSQRVLDFTLADVTSDNGVLSSLTITADPRVYTATFTPNNDVDDATNVITLGVGWSDVYGNFPTGASISSNYVINNVPLTVVISSAATSPTALVPIPITVTFSKVVTGFAIGDLVIADGTAGNFATADNTVFTFNLTPSGSAVTVDIAAGVCQDGAGNDNTAATQFAISYQPWTLVFNGTNATVNCGSDAGLDNLHDNAFTAEIFIKYSAAPNANQEFLDKEGFGGVGWNFFVRSSDGTIRGFVQCATTDAALISGSGLVSGTAWHHVAVYFNDAGDRKIYLAYDGIWVTLATQTAGVDAIVSDASSNFRIGGPGSFYQWKGSLGWCRISNNDRYSHGVNFTPPKLGVFPAVDANTLGLWKMTEGTGTALDNAEGTAARDGAITAATWEQQTF